MDLLVAAPGSGALAAISDFVVQQASIWDFTLFLLKPQEKTETTMKPSSLRKINITPQSPQDCKEGRSIKAYKGKVPFQFFWLICFYLHRHSCMQDYWPGGAMKPLCLLSQGHLQHKGSLDVPRLLVWPWLSLQGHACCALGGSEKWAPFALHCLVTFPGCAVAAQC